MICLPPCGLLLARLQMGRLNRHSVISSVGVLLEAPSTRTVHLLFLCTLCPHRHVVALPYG